MNYRDYKDFAEGEIYHIYNRGVGKMDIFLDDEDFAMFINRLSENLYPELLNNSNLTNREKRRKLLPANSFELISYCLMPNHFHFLIQQKTELSIGKLILKISTSYSKYFNKKNDRIGAVFQDRFKAVRVDSNEQLLWLSYYIHNNPRKAGIIEDLLQYQWGSYLDYVGIRKGNLCKKEIITKQLIKSNYSKFFNESQKIENTLIGQQDLLIDFE